MMNNIDSVEYVNTNGIEGDIVEIGVWKGGSMLSMILAHERAADSPKRTFHLYDTFEGMSPTTDLDKDNKGISADTLMEENPFFRCISSLEEVKGNIEHNTDIVPEYHVGDILKNTFIPERIAILRLDTDWYESTKHELDTFYESVVPGGVVIIDDYGYWQGCKKAVDEFLESRPEITLLNIDSEGRYFIKPKATTL